MHSNLPRTVDGSPLPGPGGARWRLRLKLLGTAGRRNVGMGLRRDASGAHLLRDRGKRLRVHALGKRTSTELHGRFDPAFGSLLEVGVGLFHAA